MKSVSLIPVAFAIAMVQSGCAGKSFQATPEEIPRLEQEVTANPTNEDALIRLGAAYVSAKRYEDAKRVLTPVVSNGSDNGAAYLYLGIANEELDDFSSARLAYERYIEIGRDADIKKDITDRLILVSRLELKQQAKAALAREQAVSQEPPTPNTIAVLPFNFPGATEEMRPLQTALADMLITDLSVAPRALRPVERARMQAMIDEMLLSAAGFTDPSRTTQAGRLLKAENVVQGLIAMSGPEQIRVNGSVLNTVQRTGPDLEGQSALERVFDLEKQLAFRVFGALNITLTDAERQRINDNRTTNLLAFLAYGRGLEALDDGNYTQAQAHFSQAIQIDPQFSKARAQRAESIQLEQAGTSTTEEIAIQGSAETSPNIEAPAAFSATTDLLQQTASEVNYTPGQNLTAAGNTGDGSTRNSQTRNNGQQEAQGQSSGGLQQALKATINIRIPNPTRQ